MFKNVKLGTKIGLGFGALIVIALLLGGLSVWSMVKVKTDANTLANANVPEVSIANEVERDALQTMYEARGYAYTEEKKFLDNARTNLEQVKKDLKNAKDHAAKFDLAVLKQNADKAEAKALEYEQLLNDTVAKTDAMARDKAASLEAADKYMKVCYDYLANQTKRLGEEIALVASGGAKGSTTQPAMDVDKVMERVRKITLCNDVIDLGNLTQNGTWRSIATRDPQLFQATEKRFDDVNKKLDELKSITRQEANLKAIEECRAAGNAYLGCMQSFLANWFAREELGKKRMQVAGEVLDAAKTTAIAGMEDMAKASAHAASSLSTASTTMIVGLLVAVLTGILLAVFITRSITKPIGRIIEGLTSGAEQTTSAATQVSSASQAVAEGASEQAAAIEETSSSLEEMASMVKQNAGNAEQANSLMADARNLVARGQEAMGRLTSAIEEIKKSSDETAKIVKTIDEIAFQTNLLALNAAVEAARAGDAGKGFAVVAEEVRNLAQRAGEAARNTASLIEGSVKYAENGVSVASETAKALEEITGSAQKVSSLVSEIASASNEQAQGIDQVTTAVSQMDQVTQQNAANAEESASASEELSAQAEQLHAMVQDLIALVRGSSATQNMSGGSPVGAVHRPQTAARASKRKTTAKSGGKPSISPTDHMIHQHLIEPGTAQGAKSAGDRKPSDVIPLDSNEELAKF